MEWVLGAGAVAIAAILVWSVVSIAQARRRMVALRADLERAETTGAQPASLYPSIDPGKCIGTAACVAACPETNVIAVIDGQARLANPTSCIGHGECLRACPVDAIRLVLGTERRGVDIPLVGADFESNVEGLFVVGELGGMGLIYNAMTQALQCLDKIVSSPPPKVDGVHQVAIVGAGPAGMAATLSAQAAGLDYVTLDQESIGGTVLQYPRQKIVMTRPVRLPLYGPVKVSTVRKEALLEVWQDILEKTQIQVRTGVKVDRVERADDGVFTLTAGDETIRAQRVVLAMGRRGSPRKLGIPGEDLPKVAYRLLEPEEYAGRSCLVVGGGDAGVEAAIALGEAGARVHLAHRRQVFDRIKSKNQSRLDEAVEAGRVELLLEAKPLEIHSTSVSMQVGEDAREIENDFVFVFAGGVLPTAFLEAAGIEVRAFKGEVYAPAN